MGKRYQAAIQRRAINDLKRSGTTVASDLNAEKLGTIAEDDGAVENVSFILTETLQTCVVVRTLLIPVRLALSSFTKLVHIGEARKLIHKCNDYMGWRLVQKKN